MLNVRLRRREAHTGPGRPRDDAPQDAHHEVCGSPLYPAPGWDWKFDREANRFRAIDLRPKTSIPEWKLDFDPKLNSWTSVLVDPRLTPEQAYHPEYGSPLSPAPGWKWELDPRTQRFIPSLLSEPSPQRFGERRPLYRWHPDNAYYSLVPDWEQYEDDLYEYDAERSLFKRYRPKVSLLKPRHQKVEPEPETPRRRLFAVRLPNGNYAAVPRRDEYYRDDLYEYDANKNEFVPVTK